ncbi:MAG: UDP-N-acetylmuramoyl-tripeptide--D-alanyl-D-alanine ligase [Patescibacteria group bacterium]|jgi:UDP-N-acetylmuramoyl-tripeptide--D-alanyl-D-alanine ligase
MLFNPHKIIKYQLYLLQLENYNLKRFWQVFLKSGFSAKQMRQELVWTNKLKFITFLTTIITVLIIAGLGNLVYSATGSLAITIIDGLINLYILSIIFGVLAIAVIIIISPLDYILKQRIINQAKTKIKQHKNLKIIGITGSYGKTTMKEVIAEILAQKYKILKTEENKNTPLGISRLILEELNDEIDIFIVEMGAYQRGDIKKLCGIARPGIAVLTGINESHLERFGSMENTIAAKFEIVKYAKENAKVMLNADDIKVMENYEEYADKREVLFYSAENNNKCEYKIANKEFLPDGGGQRADILNPGQDIGNIKTSFLGDYIFGDIVAGIIIARELGMEIEMIRHGISRIKPIEHRLQKINSANGVIVIDDSYNGNPNGVREAIKVLAKFKNKRKIYITPGLVETGEKNSEIHYNIGKQLSSVADKVILIKNSATSHIEKGLLENSFNKKNIIWFESAAKMHEGLKDITQAGDVVLFQNDWTDNYV